MLTHVEPSSSFLSFIRSFKQNRRLVFEMSKREIRKKYQGSLIGLTWAFINPLLMLFVYTFVFSVIFKSRWGGENESRADFAIILFAGLIVFGIFSESLNQAPSLIVNNVNYVKKVVFPLEILSLVSLGGILFHAGISVLILIVVQLLFKGYLSTTVLFFPLIILPLVLMSLGASWFFSALGVFVRDIGQVLSLFITILLFTSAVFFPITALPERYRGWLKLNPLALVIEESRRVLVYGQDPDWMAIAFLLVIGSLIAYSGYWWFQKTRKGFADVL